VERQDPLQGTIACRLTVIFRRCGHGWTSTDVRKRTADHRGDRSSSHRHSESRTGRYCSTAILTSTPRMQALTSLRTAGSFYFPSRKALTRA
jgi:hypothetical protein